MDRNEVKRGRSVDDTRMEEETFSPGTKGKKKARKSGLHISVDVDLADIARSHFTSEGTDSETIPLYLSLKEMIEKSKAEVVVMLLRVVAKGQL
jgi:hypothetical protein